VKKYGESCKAQDIDYFPKFCSYYSTSMCVANVFQRMFANYGSLDISYGVQFFFLIPLQKERYVFLKIKIKILHQPILIHFLKNSFVGYE
jgi:hypothetical protein